MEDALAAPSASATVTAAARVPAAAAFAAVAPPPLVPQQVPAAPAVGAAACRRQVFSVELRPGETTIVSWKKLLKEAGHAGTSPPPPAAVAAEPAFAAQHSGPPGAEHPAENGPKDLAQPNQFNAVIEKIERLYIVDFPRKPISFVQSVGLRWLIFRYIH